MCGITGIIKFNGDVAYPQQITAMNRAMSYRGPDGEGIWAEGQVCLGHLRLAIIDLTAGDQPMTDDEESLIVVFNGEIYNFQAVRTELELKGYQFQTKSDTEVLIHGFREWGRDLVLKLNGMFAFAIYDKRKRIIFIARDRLGVKPLYYFSDSSSFAFASEMGGLMASGLIDREIDQQALDLYLHYQYIPAPLTIYRQAKKARAWMLDRNRARQRQDY